MRRNAWAIFGRLLFFVGLFTSIGTNGAGILALAVGLALVVIGELVDIRRAVAKPAPVDLSV